jgi:SIT family siderophore-iron:H+ symporter-like MFS transporter
LACGASFPVLTAPLLIAVTIISRRAEKAGHIHETLLQKYGFKNLMMELFWLLDVIGIVLLVAFFALILVPLTLAGGVQSKWTEASILAPLIVGVVLVPVFVLWEFRAPHPVFPFRLMKDRSVWAAFGIAVMLNFCWYMQGNYLYTVLVVAFDMTIKTATRVSSFYSFFSVITGAILGFVVFRVRRLKPFIVFGTMLFLVAFGLLIRYRGGASDQAGVIGAEIVLGVAGGMFPYPAQASLQVSLHHENLATMTAIYLATYNIGSALGNAVAGAIWSNTLPQALSRNLAGINDTLAVAVYGNPFAEATLYPMGTPERDAIVESYKTSQRFLTVTGICLCVPLIVFSLCLRNPRLNDNQTLATKSNTTQEVEQSPETNAESTSKV